MTARTARRPKHSSVPNGNRGTAESAAKVATGLAALPSLSHAELKSQWVETFGAAVPKGLSHRLMIYALAYEVQKLGSGGLKSAVRQELRQVADPSSSKASTDSLQLTPGTRLMREWRGTVHVVDVTDDGLVWNGRVYASLSAIARTITGTRWSGHRFFGLRKRSDALDASKTAQARASSDEALQIAAPQTDEPLCSNEQGAENSASLENIMEVATSGPPSIDREPETVS